MKKVVIVGGGDAGMATVEFILERMEATGVEMDITLIKREKTGWFGVCALPFALQGRYPIKTAEVKEPRFYIDKGIDFRTETEVTKINLEDSSVRLNTGEDIKYDYLVIATGRKPSIPPAVKETEFEGVYTFNNEEDAEKIMDAMKDAKCGFVRGRGIIGMQAAVAFSMKGLKTTVLGGPPSILPSNLDPDMASIVQERLKKAGIKFILEKKR
ncbi:MAG: FAD-dependent oxidoreductase [archaeon]|nr:FAD-dependent oxidoreductase [archaeon]